MKGLSTPARRVHARGRGLDAGGFHLGKLARFGARGSLFGVLILGFGLMGCQSTKLAEVRGKTQFGPEYRNKGDSTHETRYDTRQGIEMKWDNGWTTGVTYRVRAIDEGSGDNEHLVLFEVGYPLWKAPNKPEKTAERFDDLEREVSELQAKLAAMSTPAPGESVASATDKK